MLLIDYFINEYKEHEKRNGAIEDENKIFEEEKKISQLEINKSLITLKTAINQQGLSSSSLFEQFKTSLLAELGNNSIQTKLSSYFS